MHILHLVNNFPSVSQVVIYNELADLMRRGNKVTVVARNQFSGAVPELLSQHSNFAVINGGAFVKWCLFSPRVIFSSVFRVGFSKNLSRKKLLRLARSLSAVGGNLDIVHCQFINIMPTLLRFRELGCFSAPIVCSVRGNDLPQLLTDPELSLPQVFSGAAHFLPVSRFFADMLVDLGCPPEKLHVHYTPVDFTMIHAAVPDAQPRQGTPVLLSVGRLVEKKGFRYSIEALSKVLPSYPEARLIIVGDGPLLPELKLAAKDHGVIDQVEFIESLPHAELLSLFQRVDLFVLHCVTDSSGDREGIPNVLKESMALQLPVVSTRHAGVPELITHEQTGLLCDERDVDAYTGNILKVLGDQALRRTLTEAAFTSVHQRFGIDALVDELVHLYNSTISEIRE